MDEILWNRMRSIYPVFYALWLSIEAWQYSQSDAHYVVIERHREVRNNGNVIEKAEQRNKEEKKRIHNKILLEKISFGFIDQKKRIIFFFSFFLIGISFIQEWKQ